MLSYDILGSIPTRYLRVDERQQTVFLPVRADGGLLSNHSLNQARRQRDAGQGQRDS